LARLFFALELNDSIRQVLMDLRPQAGPGLKPVPPDHWHITLHFLADADPESVVEAVSPLEFPPFTLKVESPGWFRTRDGGSILWVGFARNPILLEWHGRLGKALQSLNLPVETRPLKPHVTLARAKPGYPRALLERFLNGPAQTGESELLCDHCTLFSSTLTRDGPFYERVARFPL